MNGDRLPQGWLDRLDNNQQAGSRPRCIQLMSGDPEDVANRLNTIVNYNGVGISANDERMPRGIPLDWQGREWDNAWIQEATLGGQNGLIDESIANQARAWWLANRGNIPHWDIASTCKVNEERGILLIEAKAHAGELEAECRGKELRDDATEDSFQNHVKIGHAIADAAAHLYRVTEVPWAISRDTHYQLSNRFAWAWKLADLGLHVVLVYLGFLEAEEMGNGAFADADAWERCILEHSKGIVPEEMWGQHIALGDNRGSILPLIRSVGIGLPQ
jgi:hypothetical protein